MHRLTVLLAFLFATFEADVSAYDLQRLFINVEGGNLSIVNAWDIDDSGVIVGFYFQSPSGSHGFIYDLETKKTTTLDVPGAEQTSAFGNNDSGGIVGKYMIGGVTYGFLYDGASYTTLIAKQVDDDIWDTSAYDINDSGVIVGESPNAFEGTGGFTYSGGEFAPLYGPAGESAIPRGSTIRAISWVAT